MCLAAGKGAAVMKLVLLGTGFGQTHAAVYARRGDVDQVVVFGRTWDKLATARHSNMPCAPGSPARARPP